MRPAQAVPPVHVTYSVTFASPPVYSEAWSRFPYSVRLGDQALRRASVPSETDPSYVDWFRVCSHPYVVLAKDRVPVLVQLKADWDTLVF